MTTSKRDIINIRKWMIENINDYIDHKTGELNCTSISVDCAYHLDHNEWIDDDDHIMWDIAVDISYLDLEF